MADHPGIIPGWPGYLGIPGYLDKGGAYSWPSWDKSRDTWTRGVYGCPSWNNPWMARLLGNPGILGKGGYMAVHAGIIPGWPGSLGILGYLDKGGIWLSYLG